MNEPIADRITREQKEKIRLEREGRSIAKLQEPTVPIGFEQWRQAIQEAFPELSFAIEVEASLGATLLIHDIGSCIALLLMDTAGSGKTIALNVMTGIDDLSYATDSFTGAAFVSNSANTKKADLKHIDLLPRIRNKVVIFRDMAPLFAAREDDMTRTMGALTRILDGEGYQTDTGTHGRRSYSGDYRFILLGATTPIDQRVWRVMSRLGPRILFLHLHGKEKSEQELAGQLRDDSFRRKIRKCQHVTDEFFRTLWHAHPEGIHWKQTAASEDCLHIISRCAKLLSRLRGQVSEDHGEANGKRTLHVKLISIERPDRINQAFYDAARGHAVIMGRTALTIEDMPILLRMTFDTVQENRWPFMRHLIANGGSIGTAEVQHALRCSNPTALRTMETFCVLGVCEPVERTSMNDEKRIRLRGDFHWFLGDECRSLLERAGLFRKADEVRSKQP